MIKLKFKFIFYSILKSKIERFRLKFKKKYNNFITINLFEYEFFKKIFN